MNTQSPLSDANTHDHIGHIIVDSASALFQRFGEIAQSGARPATERRSWNAESWAEFERAGFGLAMLPEELGGVEPRHALTILPRIARGECYFCIGSYDRGPARGDRGVQGKTTACVYRRLTEPKTP